MKYLLKRLLLLIPGLIISSLILHTLNERLDIDRVNEYLNPKSGPDLKNNTDLRFYESDYVKARRELLLDLPGFYFYFGPASMPDTLYKIPRLHHQHMIKLLLREHGNWPQVQVFYQQLLQFNRSFYAVKFQEQVHRMAIDAWSKQIQYARQLAPIQAAMDTLPLAGLDTLYPALNTEYQLVKASYQQVIQQATPAKNYWPAFAWHGFNNRYHVWFTRFLSLQWGNSYKADRKPIKDTLRNNIAWTAGLSLASMLLAFAIAVPLGLWAASRAGSKTDTFVSTFLFGLYAMPSFWVAILLLTFFTQPQYFDWFPSQGTGYTHDGMTWLQIFVARLPYLILPLITWTYPLVAVIFQHTRVGIINSMADDYIRTAFAKGLPKRKVLTIHALRNNLGPLIVVFASMFPRMITGSVVLEYIFNLPGLGKQLVESISYPDYPMVFVITMLVSFITMLGFLLADFMLAWANPKLRQ